MDYFLLLNKAATRDLPCAVCGKRPAPHLLAVSADHVVSDSDLALCDLHTAGLQDNSGVSRQDLEKLRGGRAPESWH